MPTAIFNVGIDATSELAAAAAGTVYVVESFVISNTDTELQTGDAQFKSGTTAISGNYKLANPGILNRKYQPSGHFRTAAGEALNLTTATIEVQGEVVYRTEKG